MVEGGHKEAKVKKPWASRSNRRWLGAQALGSPVMPAVLANANALGLLLNLLSFRHEDLHNKRGQSKEKPFNRNPGPSNTHPPDDSMVLVDEFRLLNDVDHHIGRAAFRASHSISPFIDNSPEYSQVWVPSH